MTERRLPYSCVALADQIQAALADTEIEIEEHREVLVDDLWNQMDVQYGSRINRIYKKDGTVIDRPSYVRYRS